MKFYTYLYLRKNGTPYYVGKGQGKRAFVSRLGHNPPERARIFIQHWASEEEALEMEKWYISIFGRKGIGTGILHNRTDGGTGIRNISEETRSLMAKAKIGSQNAKGHKVSEEVKAANSARMKGKQYLLGFKFSEESKLKMRNSHLGKRLSEEQKRKIGEKLKGHIGAKSFLGRKHTEQSKRQMSESKKGIATRGKGWNPSEETKEKMRHPHKKGNHIGTV
jgi:hypothetical protein